MKLAAICLALCALSSQSAAEEAAPAPVDRALALTVAPKFDAEIQAALTRPINSLYAAAEVGSVHDKWVYALALSADRHTYDPVPLDQRKLYQKYMQRVDKGQTAYQKKHKDADTSTMPLETFAVPTEQEAAVVRLVDHINTPDGWLESVRAAPAEVEPVVLVQSLRCVEIVRTRVEADEMMSQLLGAVLTPDGKGDAESNMAQVLAELQGADKSDEDLDDEAVCGGEQSYARDIALMKAIYVPQFQITVSKDK